VLSKAEAGTSLTPYYGSALEAGHAEEVLAEAILPRLDEYMGGHFEEICRDWLRLYGRDRLPGAAREEGRIWAADYDIDVAASPRDSWIERVRTRA